MPRRIPRLIDSQVVIELSKITPDARQRILRYAVRRVRMIAEAGCPVAGDEPDILVADAIADTVTGVVVWDRRYPLSYHLCSVLRTRTWNLLMRARRQRRVSLGVVDEQDELIYVAYIAGDCGMPRADSLLATAHVTRKLYGAVRRRAIHDRALSALLDAYAHGFVKPREVMTFTRMTRAEIVNARRRLNRALIELPLGIRRAAQDLMRGSIE